MSHSTPLLMPELAEMHLRSIRVDGMIVAPPDAVPGLVYRDRHEGQDEGKVGWLSRTDSQWCAGSLCQTASQDLHMRPTGPVGMPRSLRPCTQILLAPRCLASGTQLEHPLKRPTTRMIWNTWDVLTDARCVLGSRLRNGRRQWIEVQVHLSLWSTGGLARGIWNIFRTNSAL